MAKKVDSQKAKDAEKARQQAHEALCRRCGVCCHQKVRFGDVVVITDVPCEFLDTATNACTVYPERFIRQPLCSSADVSAATGTLPDDCPYVAGRSDYVAPLRLEDHPEYEPGVNALFPERLAGMKKPPTSAAKCSRSMQRQRKSGGTTL
ncbi:MAG: hypothetical protein LUE17_12490 [Planctomycetaceae bacterium]|nr:hypothetical protein [Planctomycetaceae bacterium]